MESTISMENLTGGCQCGHIRYHIDGDPVTLYACHCLHCQSQSSSAFGLSMWVKAPEFKLLSRQLKFWTETAGDSSAKVCAFCPACGSRIYHALEEDREILSLKAGSLDDKSILTPIAHIWVKRAHDWLALEQSGAPCYDTEPESFDEIVAAWSNR